MPRKKKAGDADLSKYDIIQQKSEIKGPPGSQYINFKLDGGESIIAATGAMIYMNSSINKAEIAYTGITSGIKRMLSGETFVYQKFTGNSKNGNLMLGSNFINSIISLKIYPGGDFRLSRYSFLACTDNIEITWTTQMKGILGIGQEEGFILPVAKCTSGSYGYIWLSTFGNFERIEVPTNEHIIVDNGMFLACNNDQQYEIERIGKSLFSSLLGGEGFGMKFIGPCTVFIQTKNINEFLQQLGEGGHSSDNNIATDIGKGFFNGLFGDS